MQVLAPVPEPGQVEPGRVVPVRAEPRQVGRDPAPHQPWQCRVGLQGPVVRWCWAMVAQHFAEALEPGPRSAHAVYPAPAAC